MVEEQQQKSIPYTSPYNVYGGSIINMTSTEEELHKMELTLRSKEEREDGSVVQIGDPLMNDYGIIRVMGQVRAVVKRDTIMNDFEKKDIPMLIDFLGDTLAKDLMINRITYELGKTNKDGVISYSPSARDVVYFTVLSTAFIVINRGREGGDRRFWKGTQQDIRHVQVMEGRSKGVLARLNPWSK